MEKHFGPLARDPLGSNASRQLTQWGYYNPTDCDCYALFLNGFESAEGLIGALAIQLSTLFCQMLFIETNLRNHRILKPDTLTTVWMLW